VELSSRLGPKLFSRKTELMLNSPGMDSDHKEVMEIIQKFKSQTSSSDSNLVYWDIVQLKQLNPPDLQRVKVRDLKEWEIVMMLFGSKLHRTSYLNELLLVVENEFNSKQPASRCNAFKSWRILILNFQLKGHLFHRKRYSLILVPLINSLRYEKMDIVKDECVKTLLFLFAILTTSEIDIDFPTILENLTKSVPNNEYLYRLIMQLTCSNIGSEKLNTDDEFCFIALAFQKQEVILRSIKCLYPQGNWNPGIFPIVLCVLKSSDMVLRRNCVSMLNFKLTTDWESNSDIVVSLKQLISSLAEVEMGDLTGVTLIKPPNRPLHSQDYDIIGYLFDCGIEWLSKSAWMELFRKFHKGWGNDQSTTELLSCLLNFIQHKITNQNYNSCVMELVKIDVPSRELNNNDLKIIDFLAKRYEQLGNMVVHGSTLYEALKKEHVKFKTVYYFYIDVIEEKTAIWARCYSRITKSQAKNILFAQNRHFISQE
jgi:hypothetical protein